MEREPEIWREIPSLPGYEISSHGDLWSFITRGKKPKKWTLGSDGYYFSLFRLDGKSVMRRAHVLVALAFIGERPNGQYVHHINGIKTDNYYKNLKYIKPKDHLVEHDLCLSGPEIAEMRYLYMNHIHDIELLAKEFSLSQSAIYYHISDLIAKYGDDDSTKYGPRLSGHKNRTLKLREDWNYH